MANQENKYPYRYQKSYKGHVIDIKAKSTEEKWEKVAQKKHEIDNFVITSSTMKLSDWIKQYLEDYKRPVISDRWYVELVKICKKIEEELGPYKLRDIKPVHLQQVMNKYRGLSLSYRKKIFITMREIFRLAYENSLIPDISKGLALPTGKPGEKRRSLTDHERKILLQVADCRSDGLFLKLMLYCGLRPSEVVRLKWSDIGRDMVSVKVSKTKAGIRQVPIPEHFTFERGNPFSYVFVRPDGKSPYNKHDVDSLWKNVKKDMVVIMTSGKLKEVFPTDLTMYCLRHTYCTDLEKLGVPINIARVLMGHSSIEVTAQIYTHFDDDTMKMARDLIDGKTQESGNAKGKDTIKP